MGAHRLHISTAVGNAASQHVAKANGFVQCGTQREAERMGDGSLVDVVDLELIRSRWLAQQRPDPTSSER